MDISWQTAWPDQASVREEVEVFVQVVQDVLLDTIPPGALRGLYYKGSALKSWDSALDYVPEVSDVDFHVWLRSDEDVQAIFGSLDLALDVQARLERAYLERVPSAIHFPRAQFVIMNHLVSNPDYTPPAPHLVRVLKGEPSPTPTYDESGMRQMDCKMALSHENYLQKLPSSVMDKPGRLIWDSLRNMCFRVSPAGPRAIHLLGVPAAVAWESNRTRIYGELIDLGQQELAYAYADYYAAGWAFFLSDWKDTDAGRRAIRNGVEVLQMTADIASQWLAEQDDA